MTIPRNGNKNRGLNGLNPLSYLGDNPYTPSNMNTINRDPNSNDSSGYIIGDMWLNTATEDIFYLASLDGNSATWLPFTGGGGTLDFETDNGTASPTGGIIKVKGGNANIDTDAVTPNQVTINLSNDIEINNLTVNTSVDLPFLDPNAVVQTDGSGNLIASAGTDGQVLIGNTGDAPAWNTITAGSNITVTNGASTITIAAPTAGSGAQTFHTDSGDATVAANAITIAGGLNINTSGAAATVTVNLDNDVTISGTYTTTAGDVIIDNGVIAAGNTVNGVSSSELAFQKSRSGGVITTGDDLGVISFEGHDGTDYRVGAKIVSDSSGTIGANRIPANL